MSHPSSIDSNDRQIIIPSPETHDLSRIRLLTMAQRAEILFCSLLHSGWFFQAFVMKILIKLMLITTACFHNENWVAPLYHMAMLIPIYHISGSA